VLSPSRLVSLLPDPASLDDFDFSPLLAAVFAHHLHLSCLVTGGLTRGSRCGWVGHATSHLEWLSRPTSVRLYEVVPIALLLAPLPFLGALLFLVARPPSPTPAARGPVTLVGGQLALQVAEGPVVVVISAPALVVS